MVAVGACVGAAAGRRDILSTVISWRVVVPHRAEPIGEIAPEILWRVTAAVWGADVKLLPRQGWDKGLALATRPLEHTAQSNPYHADSGAISKVRNASASHDRTPRCKLDLGAERMSAMAGFDNKPGKTNRRSQIRLRPASGLSLLLGRACDRCECKSRCWERGPFDDRKHRGARNTRPVPRPAERLALGSKA